MTPDETAKAEAESIATRWVPAHMTARQGMVDDIAKALVTGRRLVEEAQAESTKYRVALAEGAEEEGRIRLAWDAARRERIEAQAERDRLKGELAEARLRIVATEKLLHDRPFLDGPDERRREWNGEVVDYIQKYGWLAATPAEQAQPTYNHTRGDSALNPCSICESAAEQAQGEGAPKGFWAGPSCTKTHQVGAPCDCVAELAKRVEGLETWLREFKACANEPAPPPPEAAGPACEKLIGSLNAPCTKVRNHGGDCEHDTRKAAGPGHAFYCNGGKGGDCGNNDCLCDQRVDGALCGLPRKRHAVPPIPEGK